MHLLRRRIPDLVASPVLEAEINKELSYFTMSEDQNPKPMDSPTNSQKTVSSDDEIDYSIKPEFYDSDLDDKDELWMVKKRDGRTSDAVLSCPACFTTVCLECQRHEQYVTQYRAIFVVNCKVDKERVFQQNTKSSKVTGKRTRDSENQETGSTVNEKVNPVFCSACSTEIGVFDNEEIYHFFNVIPSEP